MALIVAPAVGAESLCSVATADAYHLSRGHTTWTAVTTDRKEQLLRLGTDYIEGRFGHLFSGWVYDRTQTLSWPRYGAYSGGIPLPILSTPYVPTRIANATAEAALKALAGELYADVPAAQVTSEKVGPIEVHYTHGNGGQQRFAVIEDLLAPYLAYARGQIALVRA